jgi:RNA polymerase sigma factor (sigma-70 family)
MRGESTRDVLRHLRTLYRCGVVGTLSDEQLLDRFAARRDETAEEAFAELVQRHGPMIFGVCRRILGDAHEAEDAFQATFLVLARKAGSVLRREKVANWLYGVAVRTAREARGRAARRRTREERVSTPVYVEPSDDGCPDELRAILDEELARLPARYRGPVVLCELEGLSRPEAARRLGIPEGTLSSRLARAKAQLRDRLASRGVSLPIAALSAILVREAKAAPLPFHLLESTVQAATLVAAGPTAAAGLSASVASLSEGVLKTMLVAKLKGIALAVGTMTAVVSGAVVLAQSGPGSQSGPAIPSADSGTETKVAARRDPDDRAAALEKKLDRILDALDRMTKSEPSPPPGADELSPLPRLPDGRRYHDRPYIATKPVQAAYVDVQPASDDADQANSSSSHRPPRPPADVDRVAPSVSEVPPPPEAPNNPLSPSMRPPGPPPPPTPLEPEKMSLADRLGSLEQQMAQVQQRLEQLEHRLNRLDARVGGADPDQSPPPRTEPVPPRPRTSS